IRWQVLIAFAGIVLLATLLGYSTYNVATVLVPDHGGVFREGVAGSPKYLNPLLCQVNDVDMDLCKLLYRGLTKIDRHGRVAPDLASGWTIADDVTYTFRLQPDQRWHDGQPITADDVLFTIDVLQDPEVSSLPEVASLWRSVTVEKVDDLSVRFSLSEAFPPFIEYTSIGLLPKHIWEDRSPAELATMTLSASPVGSGPLQVTELTSDHIRLEPSPYMTDADPYLSALELHFYPDHPSLFAAYAMEEIDGISYITPQDLSAAAAREDLQVFSSVQPGYVAIVLNQDNPDVAFFQEKEVRQALYYGLNRERLIDDIVAGQGILAESVLLPEHWAYNPDAQQYHYDPEKARQLLDQTGWIDSDGDGIRDKDGRPMEFVLYGNDDITRQALIERIALDWQELGIRVNPVAVTYAGLVGDFLAPRRFDAALVAWEVEGDPDPYPLWHSTQVEGGQNYGGWRNDEADELMEQARTLVSESDRQQLYARFQEIFAEEAPALLLYYPVYTYGVSNRVHNVQVGVLNEPSDRFETFSDWYILTRRVPANQLPADMPPEPPSSAGE
ncbi:MAG: peptide ABC transporter substrate-binding protein, partial [Caldilineaceae bacterium]|nr:peptide ABC transporter substrate-binding protein [Caldilineaceae bacterium]